MSVVLSRYFFSYFRTDTFFFRTNAERYWATFKYLPYSSSLMVGHFFTGQPLESILRSVKKNLRISMVTESISNLVNDFLEIVGNPYEKSEISKEQVPFEKLEHELFWGPSSGDATYITFIFLRFVSQTKFINFEPEVLPTPQYPLPLRVPLRPNSTRNESRTRRYSWSYHIVHFSSDWFSQWRLCGIMSIRGS